MEYLFIKYSRRFQRRARKRHICGNPGICEEIVKIEKKLLTAPGGRGKISSDLDKLVKGNFTIKIKPS